MSATVNVAKAIVTELDKSSSGVHLIAAKGNGFQITRLGFSDTLNVAPDKTGQDVRVWFSGRRGRPTLVKPGMLVIGVGKLSAGFRSQVVAQAATGT
jgi:hypothetical protein